MTISSNTIVKNGTPFIVPVIENVLPVVHRALITVSTKSNDGTIEALGLLVKKYPDKVKLYFETVKSPDELTQERQKLLEKTYEDWVLFLDADDLWETSVLKESLNYLNADVDGYAVNPYQVIDKETHDGSWSNKWFTKFFRKTPETHYRHPWPKDLIYKGNELLYWKTNPRVPRIPIRYWHLSNLMNWRFRDEKWAEKYKSTIGHKVLFDESEKRFVKKIWNLQ